MKNVLFLIIVGITMSYGLTIKGVTLGSRGNKNINTTYGGIQVVVSPDTLNDGRTYSISIIPSKDGLHVSRIYNNELSGIIKGMENAYGINFNWYPEYTGSEDGSFHTEKNGITYTVIVDNNPYFDAPNEVSIWVVNTQLYDMYLAEKQRKVNADF